MRPRKYKYFYAGETSPSKEDQIIIQEFLGYSKKIDEADKSDVNNLDTLIMFRNSFSKMLKNKELYYTRVFQDRNLVMYMFSDLPALTKDVTYYLKESD